MEVLQTALENCDRYYRVMVSLRLCPPRLLRALAAPLLSVAVPLSAVSNLVRLSVSSAYSRPTLQDLVAKHLALINRWLFFTWLRCRTRTSPVPTRWPRPSKP